MPDLTKQRPIVIAGGGIGGLAAAHALVRSNLRVHVIERRADAADSGAGLHIWGNGTLALDRLGLLDAVMERAPRQRVCSFLDESGRALGAWPVSRVEAEHGYPATAIERGHLIDVMRSSLPAGVVEVNRAVTGFRADDDGVVVTIDDGSEMEAAILVGADGVHSRIRAALPGANPLTNHGYVAWRGLSDDHDVAVGTFEAYFGRAQRFTYYDVAPGRVHWMAVLESADDLAAEDPLVGLAARFRQWPPQVRSLIERARPESVIRHEIVDRSPEKTWGQGNVTLLGDAAHPITFNLGQGACQALEDALELDQQLRQCPSAEGVADALRRYEAIRQRRTAPLQRLARGIGRLGRLRTGPGIAVRNTVMRLGWDTLAYSGTRKDVAYAAARYPHERATA